jgi:hypothetical protein
VRPLRGVERAVVGPGLEIAPVGQDEAAAKLDGELKLKLIEQALALADGC